MKSWNQKLMLKKVYMIIFRSLKPFVFSACKYCHGIEKRPQLNFLFISQLSQMTQLNLLYALHIMHSTCRCTKKSASFISQSNGHKKCTKREEWFGKSGCRSPCKKELCQNQREPKKCFKAWHTKVEAILIAFKCGLIPCNYNTKLKKFVSHFVQPGHL